MSNSKLQKCIDVLNVLSRFHAVERSKMKLTARLCEITTQFIGRSAAEQLSDEHSVGELTDELVTQYSDIAASLVDVAADIQHLCAEYKNIRESLSNAEEVQPVPQNSQVVNSKTLKDFVVEVLENSNEPLTTSEIVELVLESGFKTTADRKNLPTMVLQVLTRNKEFKKATRGPTKPYRYKISNFKNP